VTATVQIDKVNPELRTVYFRRLRMERVDDEQTAVRFTVDDGGEVRGVNTLKKRLTPYALEG